MEEQSKLAEKILDQVADAVIYIVLDVLPEPFGISPEGQRHKSASQAVEMHYPDAPSDTTTGVSVR